MLFNKEQKLGIFLVPKTGTTTSRHFLKTNGWHLLPPTYQYPEFYIAKYPSLADYRLYLFFRNPVDRFVSAVKHLCREPFYEQELLPMLQKTEANNADISMYEKVVNSFGEIKTTFDIYFAPQSQWAAPTNIEILDFDNYDAEIRRITGVDESVEIPTLNKAQDVDFGPVSDRVREFIRAQYAADYALAETRLGKVYA